MMHLIYTNKIKLDEDLSNPENIDFLSLLDSNKAIAKLFEKSNDFKDKLKNKKTRIRIELVVGLYGALSHNNDYLDSVEKMESALVKKGIIKSADDIENLTNEMLNDYYNYKEILDISASYGNEIGELLKKGKLSFNEILKLHSNKHFKKFSDSEEFQTLLLDGSINFDDLEKYVNEENITLVKDKNIYALLKNKVITLSDLNNEIYKPIIDKIKGKKSLPDEQLRDLFLDKKLVLSDLKTKTEVKKFLFSLTFLKRKDYSVLWSLLTNITSYQDIYNALIKERIIKNESEIDDNFMDEYYETLITGENSHIFLDLIINNNISFNDIKRDKIKFEKINNLMNDYDISELFSNEIIKYSDVNSLEKITILEHLKGKDLFNSFSNDLMPKFQFFFDKIWPSISFSDNKKLEIAKIIAELGNYNTFYNELFNLVTEKIDLSTLRYFYKTKIIQIMFSQDNLTPEDILNKDNIDALNLLEMDKSFK